jgi:phosphoribosylglycinamide formyltransferase-1
MPKQLKVGVLVSGRGSNMLAIIEAIEKGEIDAEVAVVISDNPEAKALTKARKHGIEAVYIDPGRFRTKLEPESEAEFVRVLREHKVDLLCLAGFMRIIHKPLLEAFPNRILNIHPALLPSFPGLNAQKQAFEYGAKVSGCTVHLVNEGVDTGPIIVQRAVEVAENDTADTLAARILREEHKAYPEAIKLLAEGKIEIEGRRVMIKQA